MKKLKILIIDRRIWGTGKEGGRLLNLNNGKMCCLGFYCRQVGMAKKSINRITSPQDLVGILGAKEKVDILLNEQDTNNSVCYELMTVNDSEKITPKQREAQIKELFASIGVKVKFIN